MEQVVKFKTHRSDYDIRESMAYAMSVSDLIDMLERCPRNAKVVFENDNGYTFGEISPNVIKIVEVETYEEEKEREEREEREADLAEIARIKQFITKRVNGNEGEIILAMSGIILDTCSDDKEDSLIVTELTTKIDGKLYGNTNWGLIDLAETITDLDDWYTLEYIVGKIGLIPNEGV
jgi:hypothetical protein